MYCCYQYYTILLSLLFDKYIYLYLHVLHMVGRKGVLSGITTVYLTSISCMKTVSEIIMMESSMTDIIHLICCHLGL